jgi:hypothetical protein
MNLPYSDNLEVQKLAGVFSNTSATYKFYWFISLIEACEEGVTIVGKKEMFSRMLANAWYTVNYFHVSFGSQDLIQQSINTIGAIEGIPVQTKRQVLLNLLMNSKNPVTNNLLMHFDKNVPHWFLTPWIARSKGETDTAYRNSIYNLSQIYANQSLYALFTDRIEINQEWVIYLQRNSRMLKDYCYWNLSNFLQVRNPNIPDIPGKLIKPPLRGSLLNQRRNYWDIVFNELGTVECIYTDKKLQVKNYALDHFIPHAFVSHDLIWNLSPIDVAFNSYKSDKLPSMELHFDRFYEVQKSAFEVVSQLIPKSKFLDDYTYLFSRERIGKEFDYDMLRQAISPLAAIAANNGFDALG